MVWYFYQHLLMTFVFKMKIRHRGKIWSNARNSSNYITNISLCLFLARLLFLTSISIIKKYYLNMFCNTNVFNVRQQKHHIINRFLNKTTPYMYIWRLFFP